MDNGLYGALYTSAPYMQYKLRQHNYFDMSVVYFNIKHSVNCIVT